jgi:pyridoxine/pyridoxamine 5'-phosphate oxidase
MTRAEFVEFVRAAKLGVVATVDAEGHPEAALVDLAVTDHGEVLFDTKAAARKVVNIGGNQRVALVVGWADKVSVQAEGDAEVLLGAEREKYGRGRWPRRVPDCPVFTVQPCPVSQTRAGTDDLAQER